MKKRIGTKTRLLILVLLLLTIFLLFAPTNVQPVNWTPPKAPSLDEGPYTENLILKDIQRVGAPNIPGPEALVMDHDGFLITGLHDGRILRTSLDGDSVKELAQTGGRPLGMDWHPSGRLIVADAVKGLLALSRDGKLETLTTEADRLPFAFTDDVDVDAAGRYAYFSDASSRWGYGQDGEAIMEHGGDGRLLRYDFQRKTTEVLVNGLQFANGVALGPNEDYVLVNETGAYRITRYWLRGKKAGTHDVFIDNLPGLPDNLSFNGKDRFWVAIYTPRNPLLDTFADKPFIRKMLVRAMQIIPTPVDHHAMVLGLDPQAKVIANLHHGESGNYSPITSVREYGEWLYLGSLKQTQMARLPLAKALPE